MVSGKQAGSPEPVCSNSCCSRFQVSSPNQPSNLIARNNSVWMVFLRPNFYLLCVVGLQRLHEGNCHRLLCMSASKGKANNLHPAFPSTVYHLCIHGMRKVTNQDNGIFLDGFKTRTKCLNLCIKISFWIHPTL
jgi:hypothetical protein